MGTSNSNFDDVPSLSRAYDWALHDVVLIPHVPRDLIQLAGQDRQTFLQSFCTNDIKQLSVGQSCEVFFCNVQGKTVGHGYVIALQEELLVDTHLGTAAPLIPHLDRYVIREDVTISDVTEKWHVSAIVGPNAERRLREFELPLPTANCTHSCFERNGQTIIVVNRNWLSVPAYLVLARRSELSVDSPAALESFKSLMPGMNQHAPGDGSLFDLLRIERGTPLFGVDISTDNLPQEVDRDSEAISFRKGCYLGQETVARLDALGHVNRKLCGLKFSGNMVPKSGTPLAFPGKSAGHVTSAVASPTCGVIGLGYVRREAFAIGTELESDHGPVSVVALPHR